MKNSEKASVESPIIGSLPSIESPTTVGQTDRGASSPANPDFVYPDPVSMTIVCDIVVAK